MISSDLGTLADKFVPLCMARHIFVPSNRGETSENQIASTGISDENIQRATELSTFQGLPYRSTAANWVSFDLNVLAPLAEVTPY